jgi:DHA3 family macrolide efflux protein-like MFS transporter
MAAGGSSYRILRNPNFVRLWLGQTVSFIGDYFQFLAVPILVERLTGSTLLVGLSLISSAAPMLFLGPVAGVFVDRWDRKKTMIVADIVRGFLVLLCLLVQTPEQIWILYAAGFLMSCVSRFFFPSQAALLPRIIGDPNDLLAANGLMQVSEMVMLVLGPALAGFTIAWWGPSVAFIVDSSSFFISAILISTMYVTPRIMERGEADRKVAAVWREMRVGVEHLFRSRTMVSVLIMMSIVNLGIGAINVVFVPYLQRVFNAGPQGLGFVDAAQGIGMIVGGLLLGILAARLRKSTLIGVALLLIGVFCAGLGLAPSLIVVVACSFALGLALTPAQSALMTLMQLAVPDEKRGRVGSAMNALSTAARLVSMAAAATLGETVGLRAIYVICGVIVSSAGFVGFRIPEPTSPETVPQTATIPAELPALAESGRNKKAGPEAAATLDIGGAI